MSKRDIYEVLFAGLSLTLAAMFAVLVPIPFVRFVPAAFVGLCILAVVAKEITETEEGENHENP